MLGRGAKDPSEDLLTTPLSGRPGRGWPLNCLAPGRDLVPAPQPELSGREVGIEQNGLVEAPKIVRAGERPADPDLAAALPARAPAGSLVDDGLVAHRL